MFDVIIIGSGIIGLSTAYACAKNDLKVLVIDKNPRPKSWQTKLHPYGRIHAYNNSSIDFLEKLGIWSKIPDLAKYQFNKMQVRSSTSKIDFAENNGMGMFVSNHAIIGTMLDLLDKQKNVSFQWLVQVKQINQAYDMITVIGEGSRYKAKALIAADGANSWTRKHCNIETKIYDYQQRCFVGFLDFIGNHEATAWQEFMEHGTFGLLPYGDSTYSLALSVDEQESRKIDHTNIINYLKQFGMPDSIKKFTSIRHCQSFPLYAVHAKNYFTNNIVLVGDAAHSIHPLAGLGLNLGLADVEALTENLTPQNIIENFLPYQNKRQKTNGQIMDGLTAMQQLFSRSTIANSAIDIANKRFIKDIMIALANNGNILSKIYYG